MTDVNDSSNFDFNLMRKHELAETQAGNVVYRRASGEIVDWAEATNYRGEQILQKIGESKAEVEDQISNLSTLVENAKTEINNSKEEAQNSLDGIVEDANEAMNQVQEAAEQITELVGIEQISLTEIREIVEGGNS